MYVGAEVLDPPHRGRVGFLPLPSLSEYAANAVSRFKQEYRDKLHHVTSPHQSPEELAQEGEQPGLFRASAASHVATLVILGRTVRPDIPVVVQRFCRVVAKWATMHDRQLIRLHAYLESVGKISLFVEL